jgi:hypothetical protein
MALADLTVYGYQFEVPKPPPKPQTSPLVYVALAVAAWWLWKSGKLAGWKKVIGGTGQ